MKPFPHNTNLNEGQRNYNNQVCRARIVSEIAFGRLKARWEHNQMYVENVFNVTTAACILHNMCETHHEHAWLQVSNEEYEQPTVGISSIGTTSKH